MPQEFDETGKIVLDDIYNCSDPVSYFSKLKPLEYSIPQNAKPVFERVLDAYNEVKDVSHTKVVDLGCSYGVHAAILKYDLEMSDLYKLYGEQNVRSLDRNDLLERDRKFFSNGNQPNDLEVVGIDIADKAAAYAEEAEILDSAIVADLENEELDSEHKQLLADADLVISTGCIGYVSEKTIKKIVDVANGHKPWMAHYVLRMFPFDAIQELMAEKGYVTAKGSEAVKQRKFASRLEQEQVLDNLIDMGIDPSGFETEGWYYADLYLSRPVADVTSVPCSEIIHHS